MSRVANYLNLTQADMQEHARHYGVYSALLDDGDCGRPGEVLGTLAAAACIHSGPDEAAQVILHYLEGWNFAASKLGWSPLPIQQLRETFGTAIGGRLSRVQKKEITARL